MSSLTTWEIKGDTTDIRMPQPSLIIRVTPNIRHHEVPDLLGDVARGEHHGKFVLPCHDDSACWIEPDAGGTGHRRHAMAEDLFHGEGLDAVGRRLDPQHPPGLIEEVEPVIACAQQ